MRIKAHNLVPLVLLLIPALLAALSAAGRFERGNFLVIENPAALKIYNKYEQEITPDDFKSFSPFCALRLESANLTLSDNFTPVDKVIFLNRTYFLLKDNRQNYSFSQSPGYLQTFHQVPVLEDSVVITSYRDVYIQIPGRKTKHLINPGTLLRRIFSDGSQTFVQTLDSALIFGWCNLTDTATWDKYRSGSAEKDRQGTISRVQNVFNRYNNLYRQFFQYFNQRSGENRTVPYWQVQSTTKGLTATLVNMIPQVQFTNSMPYLINALQESLQNSGWHLNVSDGRIEIR